MSQATETLSPAVITKNDFLENWQGHRRLTRRVIAAFPEKDFFNFSIGGMRAFSEITKELLGIAAPGIEEIVTGKQASFTRDFQNLESKEDFLKLWDEDSEKINSLWAQIPEERFGERIKAFGLYEGTVMSSIQYYVDNEIHHRGQGYVFLRALGIEPPYFYER
ncbi:MAG TPA: DinB family protein [Hanamia sp.]